MNNIINDAPTLTTPHLLSDSSASLTSACVCTWHISAALLSDLLRGPPALPSRGPCWLRTRGGLRERRRSATAAKTSRCVCLLTSPILRWTLQWTPSSVGTSSHPCILGGGGRHRQNHWMCHHHY